WHAERLGGHFDVLFRNRAFVFQHERHTAEIEGDRETDGVAIDLAIHNLHRASIESQSCSSQLCSVGFEREANRDVAHWTHNHSFPCSVHISRISGSAEY